MRCASSPNGCVNVLSESSYRDRNAVNGETHRDRNAMSGETHAIAGQGQDQE
ncbi:MAG: hypothetical protein MJA27_15675 [Pseudanabaenales cyanobacterium]|nr:hypothetical protein [Pseudanabaenales cyanobacterium]